MADRMLLPAFISVFVRGLPSSVQAVNVHKTQLIQGGPNAF